MNGGVNGDAQSCVGVGGKWKASHVGAQILIRPSDWRAEHLGRAQGQWGSRSNSRARITTSASPVAMIASADADQ